MENLYDKAMRTDKNVLITQIAEMKTYRILVYCAIFFFNIYCFLLHLVGKFNKNMRTRAASTPYRTLSGMMSDSAAELFRSGSYQNSFVDITTWLIRSALIMVPGKSRNADELSMKITRAASKILYPGEIKGKSVYEINDLVYKRYADRKRYNPQFLLRVWLILFWVLFITFLILVIPAYLSLILGFVFLLVTEAAAILYFSGRLAVWHLAKLVWLLISETGSTEAEHLSIHKAQNDDAETAILELRMRTLHSLIYSVGVLTEENKKNSNAISVYKDQIKNNAAWIKAHSSNQDAETRRIIEGKKAENRHLSEVIAITEEKTANINAEYDKANSLIYSLLENLIPLFSNKWEKAFERLEIPDQVKKSIICYYSLEDITVIEKRFYELNCTSDPSSIAKKKNGICYVPFLTASGRDAQIGFTTPAQSAHIRISNIERSDSLMEPVVSEADMVKAMLGLEGSKESGQEIKDLISKLQIYKQESLKWEAEKNELTNRVTGLVSEEKRLCDELIDRQSHIDDLSNQLEEEQEKCRKLQILIDKFNAAGDKEKVKQLTGLLADTKKQLTQKQKDYDNKVKEIEGLYAELDKVKDSRRKLEEELLTKEKELLKAKEDLASYANQIDKYQSDITSLEEQKITYQNQIVTLNGIIKVSDTESRKDKNTINRLKKEGKSNKNTIQKLKDSKTELVGKIGELDKEINKKKNEIKKLTDEKDKLASSLADRDAQIQNLKDTIERNEKKLLFNEDIYNKLYEWIHKAQNNIYIVTPFISPRQAGTMKNKLNQAARNNPNLRIKILYGIKDKNPDGSIKDEDKLIRARELIDEIKTEIGNQISCKETNTHVKLVIIDDTNYMIGSANVMSFRGKYYHNANDPRDELCISSSDKDIIQKLKEKYFNW